jgi:hypothetical protein
MVSARAFGLMLGAALLQSAVAAEGNPPVSKVEVAQPAERRASSVPEPSDLALFAAGVAGLIIGRRSSRSRRRSD